MLAATSLSLGAIPTALRRHVSAFLLPVLILAGAWVAAPLTAYLPNSLSGLRVWAPLWLLVLSAALALAFNRGRLVLAALCLSIAYAADQFDLLVRIDSTAGRAVFAAMSLIVPINLAMLAMLRERGLFNPYGARRLTAIGIQVALVTWIVGHDPQPLGDWIYAPVFPSLALDSSRVPQLALLVMLAGAFAAASRALLQRSALEAGLAVALVAFAMACLSVTDPYHFTIYIGAGAAALIAALLQDTFRLAFRDELTGLPSRRALNERLLTLGQHYTIAMVDVDLFKQFNDTHGHALGDHVLRMVASKLERVGGGGRAYRYGGEEFVVLLPGKHIHESWAHLDALRAGIAAHSVVVRAAIGPGGGMAGRERASVSVTVSIGIAERNERRSKPQQVLQAADKALYRAKRRGRDRLSL
jgi:diguanylate cyclase (GGDEF)-like protein